MKRYIKIFWHLARMNLMEQMIYKHNFLLVILAKTLRLVIVLLFFQVIYLNTQSIAGWSYQQVIMLFAIYSLLERIADITFHRNLIYYLQGYIIDGDLDWKLTKPISPLFLTAFEVVDLMDFFTFIPVIILLGYAFYINAAMITMLNLFLLIVLVIFGLVFFFAFTLIVATTAFWTISGSGAGRLLESFYRVARFPTDIFTGPTKFLFSYIIPIGVIATVPAKSFFAMISWPGIVFAMVISIMFFFLAIRFWHFGLKHYASASS